MITKEEWAKYRDTLRKINAKAANEFQDYFLRDGKSFIDYERNEIIDVAYAICTKYGEASSTLACEMYDEIARREGKLVAPAVPANTATISEVGKAINGSLKQSPSGALIEGVVQRLVKQPAADTTLQNSLRDGAQFAWIPSGMTCAFCLTLASRGWQRASKAAIKGGHAEHIHANCDCQYAIRFNESTEVEGYDPKEYEKMYYSAEGKTPREKINSMRREQYANLID